MFDDFSDNYSSELGLFLDVPFVPTDEKVVEAMLTLAEVGPEDILYDLGSGDGRIVVAAAKGRNARGVGIEMDPTRNQEAWAYAHQMGVEYQVRFIEDDLLSVDFSEATVVTMYLLDLVNLQLRPRLLHELRPGTRIISHDFDMADWKADERLRFSDVSVYKWIVPAQVAGVWEWSTNNGKVYRADLKQTYQQLTGSIWLNGTKIPLVSAKVTGTRVDLMLGGGNTHPLESFAMDYSNNQLLPLGADGQQAGPAVRI